MAGTALRRPGSALERSPAFAATHRVPGTSPAPMGPIAGPRTPASLLAIQRAAGNRAAARAVGGLGAGGRAGPHGGTGGDAAGSRARTGGDNDSVVVVVQRDFLDKPDFVAALDARLSRTGNATTTGHAASPNADAVGTTKAPSKPSTSEREVVTRHARALAKARDTLAAYQMAVRKVLEPDEVTTTLLPLLDALYGKAHAAAAGAPPEVADNLRQLAREASTAYRDVQRTDALLRTVTGSDWNTNDSDVIATTIHELRALSERYGGKQGGSHQWAILTFVRRTIDIARTAEQARIKALGKAALDLADKAADRVKLAPSGADGATTTPPEATGPRHTRDPGELGTRAYNYGDSVTGEVDARTWSLLGAFEALSEFLGDK